MPQIVLGHHQTRARPPPGGFRHFQQLAMKGGTRHKACLQTECPLRQVSCRARDRAVFCKKTLNIQSNLCRHTVTTVSVTLCLGPFHRFLLAEEDRGAELEVGGGPSQSCWPERPRLASNCSLQIACVQKHSRPCSHSGNEPFSRVCPRNSSNRRD